MPSQQEIHDLAKKLIENKAFYDKAAVYFFNLSMACSQASQSSKNCYKILKRSAKRWKKNQN